MSGRSRRRSGRLRTIAAPFTVAAPAGARVRDRLRLDPTDSEVLTAVGRHLGSYSRGDLARRVRIGRVPVNLNQRAPRKKALTGVSTSRWAGAITRVSEDQYQLSMRALHADRAGLRRAITTITRRLAAPVAGHAGRVKGYPTQAERYAKQRRLQLLTARLVAVQYRVDRGTPTVVAGGRRLVKARHQLEQAGLTQAQWRERWDAQRMFLTADGETGAPYGNYTITVDPDTGSVTVVLPQPLRYYANAPRGRYRLSCVVSFHHRRGEWLDRATANQAVRYDITHDPARGRWYLDASWSSAPVVLPTPEELTASGTRLLGVDLNAGHLATTVIDPHGNPIGAPHTITTNLTGPASTRDGQLRAAISDLIRLARARGCRGIAIENLDFADARATGRDTMGRGKRGKRFRRTVSGMPTAQFRDRLRSMAFHAGLLVVAVDPAYTSRWGGQHWQAPLQQQTQTAVVTGHHGASVAIGRRALGHGLRRRPGVTPSVQRNTAGRATGQAATHPRACGSNIPPRTPRRPHGGRQTCRYQGDQLVLFPVSNTVRETTGPRPVCVELTHHSQHN